jgi:hypothetical protein
MIFRVVARFCGILLLLAAGSTALAQKAPGLTWRKNKTADAAIEGWQLQKVLSRLAAVSGWKIFLEPGLDDNVSVQFANVSQGEALKLLLGNVNYALVPGGSGPSRLYVYKTSVTEATSLVPPESKPRNWLENEMILTLAPDSKEDVEKLAEELGGKIVAKSEGLNAYRIQFADAETAQKAREKLEARNDLATQDNYSFDRPRVAGTSNPSPASMFPLDSKPVGRGDQVTVALVDTAVQPLEGKMKDFILPAVHVREAPNSLPTDPTHGTSMAQTLLNSMALSRDSGKVSENLGNVRLLPIDIYGNAGSTTTFEVAQGLYKAIQSDARVINLSLGGTGESPMVEYLLEMATKKQILVFASAGNSPTTEPTWPAASPNILAVTAADWNGNIAPYANRGSFIDLKAPGTSRVFYNGQAYISTGTSTATAFISGQAAALAAQGFTQQQSAELMLKNFNVNAPAIQRPSAR